MAVPGEPLAGHYVADALLLDADATLVTSVEEEDLMSGSGWHPPRRSISGVDRRTGLLPLAGALSLLLAAPAEAQEAAAEQAVVSTESPPSESAAALAQGHVDQGTLFFQPAQDSGNEPNYDAALAEFEEAHRLLDGAADRYFLLWNIGQCYERLFRYDRALEYYARYLAEGGPEAADRAVVEATMRALENLLGVLEITVNVPAVTVWVDGLEVGSAPGNVRVASGVHRVELRAEGWVPGLEEVQVTARHAVTIALELRQLSEYEGIDPMAFGVTSGVAAAVLIAGAAIGITAFVDYSGLGPIVSTEDRDRLFPLTVAADSLYALGGALAIGAVVLAFMTDWDGPRRADAAPVAIVPLVTAERVGLVIGGAL